MSLLSVDPGNNTGWAFFNGTGVLQCCGLVKCLVPASLDALAEKVARADSVYVEIPQVYSGPRAKGDPNDLIQVALCAGWVISQYRQADLKTVKPAEWKGQEPKDITYKRVLASLDAVERATFDICLSRFNKGVRHNVVDAVGIGLWALRRKVGSK